MEEKRSDENLTLIASSKVDRHGTRIAPEALQQMANFINSDQKIKLALEHDMSIPPLGRINNAFLIQGEDGEVYLLGYKELFDVKESVTLEDGSILVREKFQSGDNRFKGTEIQHNEKTILYVDRINFENFQHAEVFFQELRDEISLEFEAKEVMRKSLIPDPQLMIDVSTSVAIYFLGKSLFPKLAEKISEEIAVDIAGFYTLVKKATIKMIQYTIPKNRPITYLFKVEGDVKIELVIISPKPDEIVIALSKEKLEPLAQNIESLNLKFGLDRIQFIYNDAQQWELNYLLTSKGEVIGTPKAFERRRKAIKEFNLKMQGNVVEEALENKKEK